MTRALRLRAPAKINWTLEVLRIRPDGYHEIRSVLQTLELCDTVTLRESTEIELLLSGDAGHLVDEPIDQNLAWRAADALRRRAGTRAGVRIELDKRIPIAAGLGGGSSDAAAVLRGCDILWGTDQPESNLIEIAGEIGSDPPFFVVGGTATVAGRGERVRTLPDAIAPQLMLAVPPSERRGEKTASMFSALSPSDFAEGYVTIGLEDAVEAGRPIVEGALNNVFERVTSAEQPETERAMDALRAQGLYPHLAGAGPSFFLLLTPEVDAANCASRIEGLGFLPTETRVLTRADALSVETL